MANTTVYYWYLKSTIEECAPLTIPAIKPVARLSVQPDISPPHHSN